MSVIRAADVLWDGHVCRISLYRAIAIFLWMGGVLPKYQYTITIEKNYAFWVKEISTSSSLTSRQQHSIKIKLSCMKVKHEALRHSGWLVTDACLILSNGSCCTFDLD
jgi:hypothetical protein